MPTVVQLAPDASALLTGSAAAAGALVAIVGGFLISRLVALQSEKERLQSRGRQLQRRLTLAEQHHRRVHGERMAVSLEWFEDGRTVDEMIAQRSNVDIEEFAADHRVAGMSRAEALEATAALRDKVNAAFEAFESEDQVSVPDHEERIYGRVAKAIERRRAANNPWLSGLSVPDFDVTGLMRPEIVYQRQDQRIRDERSAEAEVAALNAEIELVTGDLRQVGRPRGVVAAILILAYFAAGSVVFPLVMLAQDPITNSATIKAVVIGLFASGLTLLVGYLVWAALQLAPPLVRKEGETAD